MVDSADLSAFERMLKQPLLSIVSYRRLRPGTTFMMDSSSFGAVRRLRQDPTNTKQQGS